MPWPPAEGTVKKIKKMNNSFNIEESDRSTKDTPKGAKRMMCMAIYQKKMICMSLFFFSIITMINFVSNLASDQSYKEIILDLYNSTIRANKL